MTRSISHANRHRDMEPLSRSPSHRLSPTVHRPILRSAHTMRWSSLLLLLMMLPGLVLPAGVLMRICKCASMASAEHAAVHSCCANHSCCAMVTPEHQPTAGCCGNDHRGMPGLDTPAFNKGDGASLRAVACKCQWVQITDQQPDSTTPQFSFPFGGVPPPIATAVLLPSLDCDALIPWPAAETRPPPPDHARNLPLLL